MRSRDLALTAALLLPAAALAGQSTGDGNFAWYGVSHTHTGMTDGIGGSTPATAFTYAKGKGLDWLQVAEHNHTCAGLENGEFQQGLSQSQAATVDGSFVAVWGMEWGVSSGGHIVAFEPPVSIGWSGDAAGCGASFYDVFVDKPNYSGPNGLYEAMFENQNAWGPVIGSFAHPHDGEYNNYDQGAYGKDVMRFVEVIKGNGSWKNEDESNRGSILEDRYRWLLSRGWKVGAIQSQDIHGNNWGTASADRTGVVSAALTKQSLMTALYARHTFVTQDKNAWTTLKADGKLMGTELRPTAPVAMAVKSGDGGGEAYVKTTLYSGRLVADDPVSIVAETANGQLNATVPVPASDSYYYAVLQQADGDKLYTSPIWLLSRPSTDTPGTTPTPTRTPVPGGSTPTPTRTPVPGGSTPTPTAPAATGVVLNEYLPKPTTIDWDNSGTADFADEWIEIYNAGSTTADLSTLRLADPTTSYVLSGTLAPGCHKVYFRSTTGIALNSGSDTVYLKNASGQILDQHNYTSDVSDQSYGRTADGTTPWKLFTTPTLSKPNQGGAGCTP